MYLRTLFVSALLATGTFATFQDWDKINKRAHDLHRRQNGAFTPGTNSGTGATCSDAFGAGFLQCGTGNECFNPTAGETCCNSDYPCPAGSFCLTDGLCCPDGLDPATCAAENHITLSPGFNTSSTPKPTPKPAGNSTYTTVPAGPTTTAPITPVFTGAAAKEYVGSAAAVVGILGFLGVAL